MDERSSGVDLRPISRGECPLSDKVIKVQMARNGTCSIHGQLEIHTQSDEDGTPCNFDIVPYDIYRQTYR